MRSTEFIGLAENIRSNEMACRRRIDGLSSRLEDLRSEESSCMSDIRLCESRLAAAEMDTDDEGYPDYSRIAAIEGQMQAAYSRLNAIQSEIGSTEGELQQARRDLESTLVEKAETLREVERRAEVTSSNIQAVGGMYGSYAQVGARMQSSFQGSMSALSQAASILGGSVSSFSSGGGGASSGGRSSSGRIRSGRTRSDSSGNRSGVPSEASFRSGQSSVRGTGRSGSMASGSRGTVAVMSSRQRTSASGAMAAAAVRSGGAAGTPGGRRVTLNSGQKPLSQKSSQSKKSGSSSSHRRQTTSVLQSKQQSVSAKNSSRSRSAARVVTDSNEINRTLAAMYASGELQATVVTSNKSIRGLGYLPTKRTGRFTGEPGNSLFIPNDKEARKILRQYGEKGVMYRNKEADFSPFANCRNSPWGAFNSEVTIDNMGSSRYNTRYDTSDGRKAYTELGNYAQADIALCIKLNKQFPGANITIDDIKKFRETHKMTWHECQDLKTMQLIPTDLHAACRHLGAVGIIKYGQRLSEYDFDSVSYKTNITSHFNSFLSPPASQTVAPEKKSEFQAVKEWLVHKSLEIKYNQLKNLQPSQLTVKQQKALVRFVKKNITVKLGGYVSQTRLNSLCGKISFIHDSQLRSMLGDNYSPRIMGFYSPSSDNLYVNLSANKTMSDVLATIDHEIIHGLSQRLNSLGNGRGMIGGLKRNASYIALNEGVTEMLSIRNITSVDASYESHSYTNEVAVMQRYSEIIGLDNMKKAYFSNKVEYLERDFNTVFSSQVAFSSFVNGMQSMADFEDAGDWHNARKKRQELLTVLDNYQKLLGSKRLQFALKINARSSLLSSDSNSTPRNTSPDPPDRGERERYKGEEA